MMLEHEYKLSENYYPALHLVEQKPTPNKAPTTITLLPTARAKAAIYRWSGKTNVVTLIDETMSN